MKHLTTQLGTLLRMSAIAAAAPESLGPSAAATNDRRTHSPDTGSTHHASKSETMKIDGEGDTGHLKADTDASIQAGEAAGAVYGETSKA